MLLTGAGAPPTVVLITDLPLVWGEGDPSDVLAGRSERSATLKALDAVATVVPVDTIDTLIQGPNIVMVAQPRRLSPRPDVRAASARSERRSLA